MRIMTDIVNLSANEVIRLMTNLHEIRVSARYLSIKDSEIRRLFTILKKDIKYNYEVCLIFVKLSPLCFDLIPDINKTVEMHLLLFRIHRLIERMADEKKNEIFYTKLIEIGYNIKADRYMVFRYSTFVKKYIKYVGRDIFSLPEYKKFILNEDYCDTYRRSYETFNKIPKWPFDIRIEYKYSQMVRIIKIFSFIRN